LVEWLDPVRPTLGGLAVFLGAPGMIGLVHFLKLSTTAGAMNQPCSERSTRPNTTLTLRHE